MPLSNDITALFALTLIPASALVVQAPVSSQDQTIHVGVPLVNVYTTVLDKKNAIVQNLDQSDFKILKNTSRTENFILFPRKYSASFHRPDYGHQVKGNRQKRGIDSSNSLCSFSTASFVPVTKLSVVAFDASANILSDWHDNISKSYLGYFTAPSLASATTTRCSPASWFLVVLTYIDVVYTACLKKMAPETGRKTLVIITDAHDEGSDKGSY